MVHNDVILTHISEFHKNVMLLQFITSKIPYVPSTGVSSDTFRYVCDANTKYQWRRGELCGIFCLPDIPLLLTQIQVKSVRTHPKMMG